jgi:hypothetical protein
MKKFLKFVGSRLFGLILSLYITFVLQMLWNWFATPVFHVQSIGYWNMYGLLLIATLVRTKNSDIGETQLLVRVMTMLEACLPEEKRAETMRQLDESEVAKLFRPTAVDGMKALGTTFFLVVGLVVHSFLA